MVYSRALINNEQLEIAEQTIEKLSTMNAADKVHSLKYLIDNNTSKYLDILLSNRIENCDYYLQLGQLYLQLEHLQEALAAFLSATKFESYNSNCFYWLGKLYWQTNDQSRALKCLERCVYLHPQHELGVTLLSSIYRYCSDMNANSRILHNAVSAVPGVTCKWAWLQLGFHYLAENENNQAISAFRLVLRCDANSIAGWEGLADAYYQRGSLNSALRVYEKISELDPTNPYPKLQVGNAKTTLRLHREALVSYEELLTSHPNFFPALKGIAEAHLGLQYHYQSQRRLGRAKDHSKEAVKYLTLLVHIKYLLCFYTKMFVKF